MATAPTRIPIRQLPLTVGANTVKEVQFNQFDPKYPPTTVLCTNPGDFWIYISNIRQWIPPNTPNASYRWNGDMFTEIHTDLTPTHQLGYTPGTNQSDQPALLTFTNDPSIVPTGASNQYKTVQYPPTLVGSFTTVSGGTNQHFPTAVNGGVPGLDTYLLPAGTQSVIVVWSGLAFAPSVPIVLIVGNSDGSIFWGGFNETPGSGTGGSFSDSVFQCPVATAVDNGIRILINETNQAQKYWVLASPVPVAETVTIAGSDIAVAVNVQQVNGAQVSTAGVPVTNGLNPGANLNETTFLPPATTIAVSSGGAAGGGNAVIVATLDTIADRYIWRMGFTAAGGGAGQGAAFISIKGHTSGTLKNILAVVTVGTNVAIAEDNLTQVFDVQSFLLPGTDAKYDIIYNSSTILSNGTVSIYTASTGHIT